MNTRDEQHFVNAGRYRKADRERDAPRWPRCPAARPSMLSSRFMAFVMPTIQNTVIQISKSSFPVSGSVRP